MQCVWGGEGRERERELERERMIPSCVIALSDTASCWNDPLPYCMHVAVVM